MSESENFWLDILGLAILVFILVGMVIFMTIPRSGKRAFSELGIILGLALFTEVISAIGWYSVGANMNLAYNIFNIVNLPVAVLLYRHRTSWKNKNIVAGFIIVAFVLFGLINLFLIQGPFKYNTYTIVLTSICFMVISVTYFYALIRELPTESITKLPMFWINSAMLIYYSGTFFIYLSADYLANVLKNNMVASWLVHNFLGLIFYAILWRALLLIRVDRIRETR